MGDVEQDRVGEMLLEDVRSLAARMHRAALKAKVESADRTSTEQSTRRTASNKSITHPSDLHNRQATKDSGKHR